MANSNAPRGLVPIKFPGGGEPAIEYLTVTSTYTGTIGVGTPLKEVAAGYVEKMMNSTAANQSWVGASAEYRAGSEGKTRRIAVWTDPNQRFLIQAGYTTGNAQLIVGATTKFNSTSNTVNTTTQLSKCVTGPYTTTALAALRVIGLHERQGNDWGAYNDLIVVPVAGLHTRAAEAGI